MPLALVKNGYEMIVRQWRVIICSVSRIKVERLLMLYRRWEKASRSRLAGGGFKPPGAAAFEMAWW